MKLLRTLLRLLPKPLRETLLSAYHLLFSIVGSLLYGSPSKKLVVVGITGTKGKSTTAELVRAILAEDGKKVAIAGTIRFAIGKDEEPNLFKMTMPGRFFIQRFLRKAVRAGATHAVLEMTSEGAKQHRHKGIDLNAFVFTNISPEHIESHGSFEKYLDAKLSIARHLSLSPKRPRIIVVNADDARADEFLSFTAEKKRRVSLSDVTVEKQDADGSVFLYNGIHFTLPIVGLFNISNALTAISVCEELGVPLPVAAEALAKVTRIPGRAERVQLGQEFEVVVDYAHTPDSLRAIYSAFQGRKICVLGNTGGGRDTWKRPVMGQIADEQCDVAYLTNEDPYDEDPRAIVEDMRKGFTKKEPKIVMARREAIASALSDARKGDAVLITGKGTDPYIMGPRGTKEDWSDKRVAEEELRKLGYSE